jgi:hypothetical protein
VQVGDAELSVEQVHENFGAYCWNNGSTWEHVGAVLNVWHPPVVVPCASLGLVIIAVPPGAIMRLTGWQVA